MTYQGFHNFQPHRFRHRVWQRALYSVPVSVGLAALVWVSDLTPTVAQIRSDTRTAQQIPVNAQVVYVNPALGADDAGAGTETRPYRTITYAIQQTQAPQAVIQLAPGTYTAQTGEQFPITTRPGLIIRGNEDTKGQTTRIIGGGIFISRTFARQNVAILAENDSQIRGVTVTNPNTRGTGIWVESTNPTIRNNTFTDNAREGVFVTGRGNPIIENNVFVNNSGNGVSVAKQGQSIIRNNVFRETGFGIAVSETATPRIEDNQIIQNVDGVVVSNSARPVLRRNVIEGNTRDGIVAIADALPNLGTADEPGQNRIQNNARYDIYNATRSNTILAAGNQSSTQKIQGTVDFVARQVDIGDGGFLDVQGHWAQAYVTALAARGIVSGFPDGSFRPNDPVTRAQFAAIVNQAFSPPAKRAGVDFTDVGRSFWGYGAINTAYRGGFLSGYPGGQFRPDLRIPRVQVLVALASGLELNTTDISTLSVYQDRTQIPEYAVGRVAEATRQGIVVNYPNAAQLNPNREATRAEVAAFVYQALVSAGAIEPIESPYIVRVP